jgi:hypothetical protein
MSAKSKRKAMRSGTAVCPISGYRGALVEHHINGREVADAEGEWNRVWLSPNVHDMVHRGEIVIEGWFMSSGGRILIWRNAEEETITGNSSTPPAYGPY